MLVVPVLVVVAQVVMEEEVELLLLEGELGALQLEQLVEVEVEEVIQQSREAPLS